MSLAAPDRTPTTRHHAPEPTFSRGAGPCSVVIATVNRPVGDTGVHTHTRNLLDGLPHQGMTVRTVTPLDGSRKWLPIFAVRPLVLRRVHPTWSTRWYRYWHMAALRENLRHALRTSNTTHVLTQCPLSARAALDVRDELGLVRLTISTVCHFNRSEADEYRDKGELSDGRAYRAMLNFEAEALSQVDHVVFVSRWAQALVERDRGIATRSSSVIWNGTAPSKSRPDRRGRADVGLSDADLVLINVGTLEPRKNQVRLLELFARIVAQHPAARLVLVGEGPHRSAIEASIARLNLRDRVRLLGHRTDVADLMRLADLYVHYATAENCPTVLIEAARAALPVAALPVGGIPEILETLGDAVTLSADDHELSLARLAPLLSSQQRRAEAGRRSAEAFDAVFGRDRMVAEYARMIRALSGSCASTEAA